MVGKFLSFMKTAGWNVEICDSPSCKLPEFLQGRYKNCPQDWLKFISSVKSIVSTDETAWFLCADDYAPQTDRVFQWNEWELISLEAAVGDSVWIDDIISFWNGHLPIFASVNGGYSYYAISMEDGAIVYGFEPEFEECETVAASFNDFMKKVICKQINL